MKEMLERICNKHIVFTSLHVIDPKVLNSRKKIAIFSGVDQKSFYHLMIRSEQTSRFIRKNADEIVHLYGLISLHVNHQYKYKHLMIQAPLCSKAASLLHEKGWKIYNDVV
ncbi:conserved hypothetical protein [Sulfurospirillum deleyianum DSM 6946]|uniref:Uncharacterized protein n=1 Tax=Sulfurospirillum deleyianum (strain ATCC 51133 / DSM 6946 / 5175) TaxID=525898 RepID=D1B003_SULD5|nr:conserved hypothetical protein [Sulfurospirillum deleyianum DSM 6946]